MAASFAPYQGPSYVMGQFNSSRSPDVIYTVRRHPQVPKNDPLHKHISCNCPGWKFSVGKLGYHECKHTRYVVEEKPTYKQTYVTQVLSKRATVKRKQMPRYKLAKACEEAGVDLSKPAFNRLAKALKPHFAGGKLESQANVDVAEPLVVQEDGQRYVTSSQRVITLD